MLRRNRVHQEVEDRFEQIRLHIEPLLNENQNFDEIYQLQKVNRVQTVCCQTCRKKVVANEKKKCPTQ